MSKIYTLELNNIKLSDGELYEYAPIIKMIGQCKKSIKEREFQSDNFDLIECFIIKHNNHDYVISVLTNKNINKKRDVSITFFEVDKEDKLYEINNYLHSNSLYSEYIYTLDSNLLILVDYEI